PDVLAMVGSSAALALSGLPFDGPIGAVRVALADGKLVANPTYAQLNGSPLEIVIAGTEDAILMVESGGKEIAEDQMLEAIAFGHEQCRALARIQKDLMSKAAKPGLAFDANVGADPALGARVKELASAKVVQALSVHEKQARAKAMEAVFEEVCQAVGADESTLPKVREYFE